MDNKNPVDTLYAMHLESILLWGDVIDSRNAKTKRQTGISVFFAKTPLVTVRRTAWKNALREFEWFLSGSSDIAHLHEKVQHWWEPWANELGFIQNNYSKQLRKFAGSKNKKIDQVQYMIDTLKKDPNSRRNVITTWNTTDMISPDTPITNCHGTVIQAFVTNGELELIMYQRSADMVLGVPHNWIQYWAFIHYLAHQASLKVGKLRWIGGDCHIYPDHAEAVKEIIKESSNSLEGFEVPNLVYTPTSDEFKANDFSLDIEYEPIIKKSLKMTV